MSLPDLTYPVPKYVADTGEVSAKYRRGSHQPELPMTSASAHYLATGASTGGEFGLYRWDFGPDVSGPDAHFHKAISESFFILFGTVRLYDGEKWIDARSGDFLYVPPGGVHGFRNESGEPASMLLLFTPGAPREHYFETLAAGAQQTMTDEEKAAFFLLHDTYWL